MPTTILLYCESLIQNVHDSSNSKRKRTVLGNNLCVICFETNSPDVATCITAAGNWEYGNCKRSFSFSVANGNTVNGKVRKGH